MVFRGQTLGKYRIIEPLGSGGFATVYLAEDTWIDKRVAIKVPHRQNLDFGELLKEPRLLASMSHPNIVMVITAEKQDNTFFIVMEYVPGDTLETIIMERGPMELMRALDFTAQICNAVEHAHKHNVLHRDLRPANIFVTDKGQLKVGDFGTARVIEIAAHGTTVIGSPPYMAPEQFEGRAVLASDLYSVGVTAYQMLTGSLPYDTPAPADLQRLKRGELVQPLRTRVPNMPRVVDDIVMKALSPDVGTRYQRAEDMLNDLLAARRELVRRPPLVAATPAAAGAGAESRETMFRSTTPTPNRLRARPRETPGARFCRQCRKPLPARGMTCPFCGETQ
jgi:eukaryotic-like serine/threonine-protein kinase